MFKGKKPYLIVILGFLSLIIIGTFFLCLPICNNKPISFEDALFTATSGLTTTGFTKGSLVTQFNFWGQLVLSILMEVGAMGFIVFISYFWSIKNRKIKMSDIMLINDNINGDSYNSIKEHSIFIGKIMIEVQLIGVVLLSIKFIYLYGFFRGIWYSIFHSISAFSNCGFDLFGANSLIDFSKDVYVQGITIALMVFGSIGILAIEDLKKNGKDGFGKLKLQTKIILVYSFILLVFPSLMIKIFEPNISLLNSLFLISSSRSTGFTIANLQDFSFGSKVILIILMFIGGSPTSTSGGVKMITIAIIISTVVATLKGKNETIIFWRKIPESIIRKAFTVFTVFAVILFFTSMIFYHYNNINMVNIIFESVSAISNTGLTITNTNNINSIGNAILIFLMFAGRVGPLSMVLVFINSNIKDKYIEYPSEEVIL